MKNAQATIFFKFRWLSNQSSLFAQKSSRLSRVLAGSFILLLGNVYNTLALEVSITNIECCRIFDSTFATSIIDKTSPTRLYVNAKATGANTGLSWGDAFTDLQSALFYGNSQNLTEIWVAAGTYYPTSNSTSRGVSFIMKNGVAIYGGFIGTETQLSQRNWHNNLTILSGDIDKNDTPNFGNITSNSYHVVSNNNNGLNGSAVLDGFVIRGGNANNTTDINTYGGGGMYNNSSSPTLINCSFLDNAAEYYGGGLYNRNSNPTLINCSQQNNMTYGSGGGLANYNSSPTLLNCSWQNNWAWGSGWALHNVTNSNPSATNCNLWNGNWGDAFSNDNTSIIIAHYSLFNTTATGYTNDPTNLTTAISPYASTTSMALAKCSIAINAGNPVSTTIASGPYSSLALPPTDLECNPRIVGGRVDIGAVEYLGTPNLTRAYVNARATGANSGANWADAFTDLQSALNYDCDSMTEIWVASGIYYPTPDPANREANFKMKNGVAIFGGFAGTETQLNQRKWQVNVTTLSGDIDKNDTPNFGNNSGNSFHVIYNNFGLNLDTTAVMDGFVITGGNANNLQSTSDYKGLIGAGMYNSSNNNPKLVNCIFENNKAYYSGGGIRNEYQSNPTLINCILKNNIAQTGGGMANYYNCNPTLVNCFFQSNTSKEGGGIDNISSHPTLFNCTFQNNSSSFGGGIRNSDSNPTLINCSMLNNSALYEGGGMYNSFNSKPVVSNCIFWANESNNTFYNDNMSSIIASYSLFDTSVTGYSNDPTNLTTFNPPFVNSESVILSSCSAAINSGNPSSVTTIGLPYSIKALPSTDLIGHPRIYGGRVDMGAVEYQDTPVSINLNISASPSLTISEGSSTTLTASGTSSFNWNTGKNIKTIVVNTAGVYSVTGTSSGCTKVSSVSVVNPILPCTKVYFVTQTGAGLQNGTSWSDALPGSFLQTAITNMAACGGGQIWVGAGTYYPTSDPTYREFSLSMKNGVALYGGFNGTESQLPQRNWLINQTILSGDIDQNDKSNFVNNYGNSYHVVYNNNNDLNSSALLDGFVITSGNANVEPYINTLGGGILNQGSNPSFVNCSFLNNSATEAGGGMENIFSSPFLINCVFINNSSPNGYGGGLSNLANCYPTLVNCSMQGNSSNLGGGIANTESNPTLINCAFWNNGGKNTFFNFQSNISASYSLFDASVTGYSSDPTNLTTTSSPFISTTSVVPVFTSLAINAGNPNSLTIADGPYSATALPATDLEGNPRIFGGRIDMGAIEFMDVYTLKNGMWTDPSVWSVNRLPKAGERIRVLHGVNLPQSYQATGGYLVYGPNGQLLFGPSSKIKLFQ